MISADSFDLVREAVSGRLFRSHLPTDENAAKKDADDLGLGEETMKFAAEDIEAISQRVATLLKESPGATMGSKSRNSPPPPEQPVSTTPEPPIQYVLTYVPVQSTLDEVILANLIGLTPWKNYHTVEAPRIPRQSDTSIGFSAPELLKALIEVADIHLKHGHAATPIAISILVALCQQQFMTLRHVGWVEATENGPAFESGTIGIVFLRLDRIAKAIPGLDAVLGTTESVLRKQGSGVFSNSIYDNSVSRIEFRHLRLAIHCGLIAHANGNTVRLNRTSRDCFVAGVSIPGVDVSESLLRIKQVRQWLIMKDEPADKFFFEECRYNKDAIYPGEGPRTDVEG